MIIILVLLFSQVLWLAVMGLFLLRLPNPGNYIRAPWVGPLLWCLSVALLSIAGVKYLRTDVTGSVWTDPIGGLGRFGPVGIACVFAAFASLLYFEVTDGGLMLACVPALLTKGKSEVEVTAALLSARHRRKTGLGVLLAAVCLVMGLGCGFLAFTAEGIRDECSGVALTAAIKLHLVNEVAGLLESGVDPNLSLKDYEGGTGLHVAASYGDVAAARLLLQQAADVNARDKRGRTPLDCAIEAGHEEVAALLRDQGGIQ